MVSRVERTPFAAWWWTVDRFMLAALIMLMLGGIVLSLAASPPVAARLSLEPFYFVNRHVLYLIPAIAVMLVTSFLPGRHIRRVALAVVAPDKIEDLVARVRCVLVPRRQLVNLQSSRVANGSPAARASSW